MANAYLSFFDVGNRSVEGGTMPVPRGHRMTTEIVALGSTSVASQTVASQTVAGSPGSVFVRIACEADAWVVSGPDPLARVPAVGASAPGWLVRAGQAVDLAVDGGDRIALVEA